MQTKTQALSLKHVQQMQIEDAKTLRLSAVKTPCFDGISGSSLTRDDLPPLSEPLSPVLIANSYYVQYARFLKDHAQA
jgi:hypothetical protein